MVIVFGTPIPLRPAPVGYRLIVYHACGGKPVIHRRGINDRLESRSRLSLRVNSSVKFRSRIIVPSDHGPDKSGGGIQSDKRSLDLGFLLQSQFVSLG